MMATAMQPDPPTIACVLSVTIAVCTAHGWLDHHPRARVLPQYLDNVVGNGSNYDEAYFEVSYVRTYTTGLATVSVTSSASTATSTTSPKTETSGALASRVGLTEVLQASVLLTALLAPLITLWWL